MTRLLIIDDEPKMTDILQRVLRREGYEIDITHNPEEGIRLMELHRYDVILSDLRMPQMSGIEILKNARHLQKQADFIIMTAFATVDTAIEAMKLGAFDYLIKPFAMDNLRAMIKRLIETKILKEDEPKAEKTSEQTFRPERIIADSAAMKDVLRRATKVAPSDVSILLRGESGTGKEVIARFIHAQSRRADKPLVTVNCGAIPENLLESELFGHVKGAFTGAIESRLGLFKMADGGTIFLDEVGEIPLLLQVKLLRVLQEGEFIRVGEDYATRVSVRVIAATNRDLEAAMQEGAFRQDLYYRLNVVPIHIPPLRERREDIPALVNHFLSKFQTAEKPIIIAPEAAQILYEYDWHGNVREVENAIEHAAVLCEDNRITPDDLPAVMRKASAAQTAAPAPVPAGMLPLEEMEKRTIISALKKTGGNQTRAAELLGITRRTLGYRLKKYNLEIEPDSQT